jgi:hypothetical protein
MSLYFIKMVVINNKQAYKGKKEEQNKKEHEANKAETKPSQLDMNPSGHTPKPNQAGQSTCHTPNLAWTQLATKSPYILAPGGPKESAWHTTTGAMTGGRSNTKVMTGGSTAVQKMQGTWTWVNHMPPRNHLQYYKKHL